MSARNRHQIFAKFIRSQWPQARHIMAVADGKGDLARSLAAEGIRVTIVEAKPRLGKRRHRLITQQKRWFDEFSTINADVVVGMHPDEATIEIVRAATKQRKPWAVVPCCIKGRFAKGIRGFPGWLKAIKNHAHGNCQLAYLKMSGKNTVIFKR